MKQLTIIVAGGSGKRMNSDIPKQFLLLNGIPVLMRTIKSYHQYDPLMELIITLPSDQIKYWQILCEKHKFNISHTIVKGGKTRHHSVKNALEKIGTARLVAIHDGVRPIISKALIQTCFDTAGILGNAVPVIELSESIRKIDGEKNASVNRSHFRLVQTPQVFESGQLIDAFMKPYNPEFTEETNLVESAGYMIHLVKGQRENIKITTTLDMCIASSILDNSGIL